ncbi:MAG: NADH-quinone oxidoreductase subunit L [Spirochaetia bacterium]|jgi:NADH-quinone oxidoreductase subunit L
MLSWTWCIPALPLAGFLVLAIFGGRFSKGATAAVGAGSVGLSFAAAAAASALFMISPPAGGSFTFVLWQWITAGWFSPSLSFTLDALSVVMILVVTGVGFLIHLYSTRFMADEEGYSRFFAYMNLFVGSMLILVMASNLLLLYLGWEGVGLCSFLLIGFWYKDPENGRSARKAFIVTRIGDVSLAIGLFLIATTLGTLDIREIVQKATSSWQTGSTLAVAVAALLLGGAVGKSAQLPLQTWLPDAMAGPSPVSALIHAATMVTAGVYLIARTNALFTLAPAVQIAVGIIGAAGVLVAGLSALTQRNIKRVLAYSTMSQLGYMFLALGIGAWSGAIFHLVTHAFFKSLLFLGAGVVILAMNHEHDIFAMGGMARKSPFTFWMFLIAALTLAAIPPTTAGFSSKDLILAQAWQSGGVGRVFWALGLAGVLVTSVYIFRLVFIVFAGTPRTAAPVGAHSSGHAAGRDGMQAGPVMGIPLAILAALCLAGGFLSLPHDLGGSPYLLNFLNTALPAGTMPETPQRTEWTLQLVSEAASLLGIPVAWLVYRRSRTAGAGHPVAARSNVLARFLQGGWGFDWLYDRLFVQPFVWLAKINARDVMDRISDGVGGLFMLLSRAFRWTQNGRVRWYAAGLAAGAALIVAAVVLL